MGETGLVPEVADDPNNVKLFELMYQNVSKDLWEPLIPVSSYFGPPLVNILLVISCYVPNVRWCRRCPYNSLHNNSLQNYSLHNNSLQQHFATDTIRYNITRYITTRYITIRYYNISLQ
jgi:hypothetical protein